MTKEAQAIEILCHYSICVTPERAKAALDELRVHGMVFSDKDQSLPEQENIMLGATWEENAGENYLQSQQDMFNKNWKRAEPCHHCGQKAFAILLVDEPVPLCLECSKKFLRGFGKLEAKLDSLIPDVKE